MAKKESFTQNEITIILNNAVVMTRNASTLGQIPDVRVAKLRAYIEALLEPLKEALEEELIRPEEVVFALTCGALYAHQTLCSKRFERPKGVPSQDVLTAIKLLLEKESI